MRRVSKLDNGTEKSLERWSERKIDSVDVGGRLLEASAGGLLVGGKLLASRNVAPDSVLARLKALARCESRGAGGDVGCRRDRGRACGSGQGGSPVSWSDCRSDSQSCDSDRLAIAGGGSCRAAGSQRVDLAQVWRC
jgi:hypothetical protein